MTIYDWDTLLKLWKQEKLSPEQAIGQVFLRLQNVEGAAHGNRRDQDQLQRQVTALTERLDAVEQQLSQI